MSKWFEGSPASRVPAWLTLYYTVKYEYGSSLMIGMRISMYPDFYGELRGHKLIFRL